jgi:hypothetical protein
MLKCTASRDTDAGTSISGNSGGLLAAAFRLPFGRYGSPFSADSINNPFGQYGSPFSPNSATNSFGTGAHQPSTSLPGLPAFSALPALPALPQLPHF